MATPSVQGQRRYSLSCGEPSGFSAVAAMSHPSAAAALRDAAAREGSPGRHYLAC